MDSTSLTGVVAQLDAWLSPAAIQDYPNALNGLQLQNSGKVSCVAAAVDASRAVIENAVALGADLLLVHHGLFWSGLRPLSGLEYERISTAIRNDLAVYSSHLPLDLHPKLGNNRLFARTMGFDRAEPFLLQRDQAVGLLVSERIAFEDVRKRASTAVDGEVWSCAAGPAISERIGIVTGGAGTLLEAAAGAGADTFITGEGPHHTYALAEDLRVNLIYAGHYATETFGVKALAAQLEEAFGLPWHFIDRPSGL
jgi:dinuclear metal center YbgI/SA1388 family protein